jgi:predicted permease
MLRKLYHRLRAHLLKKRMEGEMDAELRFHLEMETIKNISRGMSAEEARLAARRDFGGVEQVKEAYRDVSRFRWIEDIWQDLRHGVRILLKRPGFTLIALVTLSLGIGVNTAVFSLVNAALLRPLPLSQPERIVEVTPVKKDYNIGAFSYPFYRDYRDKNEVFDGLAAYRFAPMSLSRTGHEGDRGYQNELVWGFLVSGNYFDVLGVRALRGRMFTQEEDRVPGANPVVVLSYGCWQRRFGGDPHLVGKTIKINGHDFTVVGIAPEEFKGTVLILAPEIYTPMMMAKVIQPGDDFLERRGNLGTFALGRLKQGMSVAQARESLNLLAVQFGREYPGFEDVKFILSSPGFIVPAFRTGTLGFAGAMLLIVALVLLIACTNLANLLLARAARRRKEMAVRLSLGAGRWRVMRQLLTENLLLALAGGAVGWLIAAGMVNLVEAFKPPIDIPLMIDLSPDWRVMIFTIAVSSLTGVFIGLAPALQATRVDLVSALKDESSVGRDRRSRLVSALVVAQIALSLVLLVAAGLILRSLQQVKIAGSGFDVERTLTVSVDLGLQGYTEARGREFYKQLISRVESLPGVGSASYIGYLPLNLDLNMTGIYAEGQPYTRGSDLPNIMYNGVWPRYFETMGISLLEGRDFTMRDDGEESRVVIINQTFARRFWPGQDPVGKRLRRGGPDQPFWQVIGVAKDSKYWSLGESPQPYVYFPLPREYDESLSLIVNTTAEPQSMINAIRHEVERLDPTLPLYDVKTMNEHLRFSLFPLRVGAWIAGSFALLALALAGLGIYGVMAYAVSQRTREIGIRMALGAQAGNVMKLVVKRGMFLALVGLVFGLAGAIMLTRLMSSVLYGVSATDFVTFVAVTFLLGLVVLIACYLPARRATRVDPMSALKCD